MNPAGMFNNTLTLTPYTVAANASDGSPVRTAGTTVQFAGSLQPRSTTETLAMGRDLSTKMAVLYYGAGTGIFLEDRVTIGSEIYRVVGSPRNVGGRGVYYEVDLELESGND